MSLEKPVRMRDSEKNDVGFISIYRSIVLVVMKHETVKICLRFPFSLSHFYEPFFPVEKKEIKAY
jgi:hypothetical protein